ncbi:MAG: tripartite tricarboxylate transporter substrate binding protein, partial [Rhodospirillales bacterium]|nr:tripartite tricarboxylate transporter substrate binding protein [Rhodospirillales bacterium]
MLKPLVRLVVAGAVALSAASVWAQAYPSRVVRIIVPFGTGGPDIVARVVAARLGEQLGQTFIVDNRPGANGIIGADAVAKAAPDGYTLLVHSSGFAINPALHKKLPYDTEKDFAPVTNLVSSGGLFIAVHTSVPAQTLQEFVALARKPDSKLSYSSPGVGNTWHLAMEVFNSVAGTKVQHVPYKGGGPATAALAAGEVQAMVASPAPLLPHYKSGRVRVLGYTAATRHPGAPDVPTTAEAGLPQYNVDGGWFGMFAPAGTPAEVVD